MVPALMITVLAAVLVPAASGASAANLLDPVPIPAVQGAAVAALERAPIPAGLNPNPPNPNTAYVASPCVPTFGPGTSYRECRLGATKSHHVVALIGDSHAWMWIPGVAAAGTELDFAVVPLTKPGCALWALFVNRPGWPCLTWFKGVLQRLRKLRPSATIVSFLTGNYSVAQAALPAEVLQSVMAVVPHPILLADPPSDDWYQQTLPTPAQCMATAGNNLGTCALSETAQMRAALAKIQAMVNRNHFPAIPTIQWFCADLICPTLIDQTVTSVDGNHITADYSRLLAPRLANWLRPILQRLWRKRL